MLTIIAATTESVLLCTRNEKLTAFIDLEAAIRPTSVELHFLTKPLLATQFAPHRSQAEKERARYRKLQHRERTKSE